MPVAPAERHIGKNKKIAFEVYRNSFSSNLMLNMGLCSLSSRYFGPKIQRSQHQPSRNDKESTLTCWPLTIVGTDRSLCGRLPTKLQNPTSTAKDAPTCIMWTLRRIVCPNSISGILFIVKMREMYELIWKCLCIVCPNVSLCTSTKFHQNAGTCRVS